MIRRAGTLSMAVVLAMVLLYVTAGQAPSTPTYAQAPHSPSPNLRQSPASRAGRTYSDRSLNFGVQDGIDHWLPASGFRPRDSATTFDENGPTGYTFRTTAGGEEWFMAPLDLPQGAFLSGIRLYWNDTDAANDVSLWLCEQHQTVPPTNDCTNLVNSSGSAGYGNDFGSWGATIDYRQSSDTLDTIYVVYVGLEAGTTATQFAGVRAFWFRQVSPAPAVASFTDVPTSHAFFQYIEALKASGITAGCTATTYCPDATLTRGQMAVFLSRALGLHWPPF